MAGSIEPRSGAINPAKRGGAFNGSPALHALLDRLIDYAGLFPPASLPLDRALANYHHYREGKQAWMLGRFVIPASQLPRVPARFETPFAVLSDAEEPLAAAIEAKQVVSTSKPTYCEVGIDLLDAVKAAGSFAKIRTGGTTPHAIPAVETLAGYITACSERRLPFKATAGLHHPIRSRHPLTYETEAPVATMHGFINVFLAAAFAWHGKTDIEAVLAETDPSAFRFDQRAHWRDLSLSSGQIAEARTHFAHSFGSCSFEEPIADLEQLGWL
ncbi:MAG TPA: hypothetical protein VHU83_12770 [Bryobacteraceae bacterium]|nr:hypothetical protein [Bryobacteraceae bacterium]